jgi:recombination protein RecA
MPKDNSFMGMIEQEFGDLVEDLLVVEDKSKLDVISTDTPSLDISLGIGGIPKGRITHIDGPESSGKTTLALSIAKNAIQSGDKVLYIDMENQLDYNYARAVIGKNIFTEDNIKIFQPEDSEHAFEIAEIGINSNEFGLIVFDSIGSIVTKKEKEDDFGDVQVSSVSRDVTKFLKRNMFNIRKNNIAFVFLNQVRDNVGSYTHGYSIPGGHALKHFSSIMISLTKGQQITTGKTVVGSISKYTIKKNKLAPPFRSYILPIIFGKGIDSIKDLIHFSETIGILKKRGPYYVFGETNLAQGFNKMYELLQEKPDLYKEIYTSGLNAINNTNDIHIDNIELEEIDLDS